jgi:hypothetical protein
LLFLIACAWSEGNLVSAEVSLAQVAKTSIYCRV